MGDGVRPPAMPLARLMQSTQYGVGGLVRTLRWAQAVAFVQPSLAITDCLAGAESLGARVLCTLVFVHLHSLFMLVVREGVLVLCSTSVAGLFFNFKALHVCSFTCHLYLVPQYLARARGVAIATFAIFAGAWACGPTSYACTG